MIDPKYFFDELQKHDTDFFAGVPTLRKACKNPESENGITFLLAAVSAVIGILCVQQRSFAGYGYVTYLFLLCSGLSVIIYRKRLSRFMSRRS